MFRLTITYSGTADAKFDFDYYMKSHMPLVMSLIGESAVRFEVAKGLGGGGDAPAPYVAVGHIYLRDLAGMEASFAIHLPTIMADVANYTNLTPVANVEAMLA